MRNRYQLESPDAIGKGDKDFDSLDALVENYKSHGLVDRDLNLIKFSIPGTFFTIFKFLKFRGLNTFRGVDIFRRNVISVFLTLRKL